jgi:DNA-binding Xre family transcriptional regulator
MTVTNAGDLDGDGISDISIRFTNVKINLMELTIKSISGEAPVVTTPVKPAIYDLTLANKLKGQILLQVQSHGEAWYINPTDAKKYYLADGVAAYNIMRSLSSGITNANLQKLKTNSTFRKKFLGKIFLQVEAHGEAYYIGFDNKLYYLKNGAAAYQIMRTKGLGISNSNLEKIQSGALKN